MVDFTKPIRFKRTSKSEVYFIGKTREGLPVIQAGKGWPQDPLAVLEDDLENIPPPPRELWIFQYAGNIQCIRWTPPEHGDKRPWACFKEVL